MIPRALRKSAEFLSRQLALALDDMTGVLARAAKHTASKIDPIKKARALIAEALRLIDRNSKDGAKRTGLMMREIALPYFGQPELWKIGTALC